MMYRVWTKLVVAGLVVLADPAMAAVGSIDSKNGTATEGYTVQQLQSVATDRNNFDNDIPGLLFSQEVIADAIFSLPSFVITSAPVQYSQHYRPASPRAPPVAFLQT